MPRTRIDLLRRQRRRQMTMNFGTWNVLSLYRPGALTQVVKELEDRNMDITAVQEIRWTGSGTLKTSKSIILFSGSEREHQFGTGFVVKESLAGSIITFTPVNERLCHIRLKGQLHNYSLIAAHAPTEEKEEQIKDNFYEQLEQLINKLPKQDMQIILGDFNAKVGKEAAYRPTIGRHSLHDDSNNNGTRLIDFATSHNMIISSTMFEHKRIHKETWVSNDGTTRNQIDHVLINARRGGNCLDVRSLRGADGDTDHFLVKAKIRTRIASQKKPQNTVTTRWNTERLQENETKEKFQRAIQTKLDQAKTDNNIDSVWRNIKSTLTSASNETLGNKKRKKKRWFDEDCLKSIQERNLTRKDMLQNPSENNIERYRQARSATRNLMNRKKREHQVQIIKEIEDNRKNNKVRQHYMGISRIKAGYQPRAGHFMKGDNGDLIGNDKEILETWKRYFCQLLNDGSSTNYTNMEVHTAEIEDQRPTYEEVTEAIKKLKNNKAPGSDDIPAECLKHGGDTLHRSIHELILRIWQEERIPEEWKEGVIIPIHKKGDKKQCINYRGITLLNTTYKILSNILLERIKTYTEEIIGDYQCGFRPGRSTTDQIFTIKQIMEKCWEFDRELHQMFIDFKQAFDRVCRTKLWSAMQELGLPKKLVNMIRICMEGARCKVKVGQQFSDTFEINNGLKQGDALSPQLFNLALEHIIRNARIETPTSIFHREGPKLLLAFADDVDLIGNSRIKMRETFIRFEKEADKMGLQINENKTKYMYMSRKDQNRDRIGQNITIDDYNFERVREFKYLGTTISDDNNGTQEINNRIQAGNRCLYALQDLLKSKQLTRRTKINLYKTVIRPVVIYGSETWTMTVANEERLRVWERKILRKIFGPTLDEETGRYRMKTNKELEELFENTNIVKEIKSRRLQWAGHIRRLPDDRIARIVWEEAPTGKRPLGRPRLRWRDNLTKDLKALDTEHWMEVARDRKAWRHLVKSAKTHPGL